MQQKKVIIIGGGFGGLALGIRLQARGFRVTIVEKNLQVGGQASQLLRKGFTFDMGPSLITAPPIIEDVFKAAGKKMKDYLELIPLDPFYRIYFDDKSYIDYNGDAVFMKEQLAAFEPRDAVGYDRFMAYAKKIYQAVIIDKLGATPFMTLKAMLSFLPRALLLNALFPVYGQVQRFFKDPRSLFTFSFHPLFIGASPFKASSVFLMIPYLEKEQGVWFTKGGMFTLVKALQKVFIEIGGTIKAGQEAKKIIVENGKATGVQVQGLRTVSVLPADIVVSNAHFAHTYLDLVPGSARKKWTKKRVTHMDYSMSCVLLYLGVKKKYPQLKHHTLIISSRYKGLVRDIFDRKVLADDFSMYVHAPTRTDPGMAPAGGESLCVLVPVPNLQAHIDWQKETPRYTKKLLGFLEHDFGLKDLQSNLEVCEVFTPEDFRDQRNNYLGSAWGVEPTLFQIANFRPHNRSEDIPNMYLVGASTHPGGGVPGVMLGAETTEKVILDDIQKNG